MKIYLVEGADGTGKSTFIDSALEGDPYASALHFGRPDHRHALTQYVVDVVELWADDVTTLYLDRSFLGSRIWAELGFHEPILNPEQWRWLCEWYASEGAEVAILLRDEVEMLETIHGRGEEALAALRSVPLFMDLHRDILYIPTTYYSSNLVKELHGTQRPDSR